MLDLSQLEAGATQLDPVEVDAGALVRDVAESFALRAQKAGIELHVDVPTTGPTAQLDPSALERIATNLIGNAVKFTDEGGEVRVALDATSDTLRLKVADTGVGIAPGFLPDLFDAFKQESTGDARAFEGTGLGLTITERLVDLMGGTIEIESEKGAGTTCTAELPRQVETE